MSGPSPVPAQDPLFLGLVFLGLLAALLVPAVMIDLRERRIPNWSVLAIASLGLLRAALAAAIRHDTPLYAAALRAAAGGALIALLNAVFATMLIAAAAWLLRTLSAGARIGMGDLKFLVAAAIWLGWDGSILVLGLASLLALLAALAEAPWRGLDLRRVRPFAPMLAASMFALAAFALVVRSGG